MRHLVKNIDAVVVGGGIAGLTSATLMAQAGRRVALFERSATIGGRSVTHREHGFSLNLGPHAWYPGGPGMRVLGQLGIPLKGRTPRPAGAFALRAGRLHTLPIGFVSLLTTDLLGVHGKLEAARLLARLGRMDTAAVDGMPLSEWLRAEIGDAIAREVVNTFIRVAMYANAPEQMSAGAGLDALRTVSRHNVRYLDGGWQTIVDALRHKAIALGAQVLHSAPVREVLHNGAVSGVRLEDGQVVLAPNVVMAVSPSAARQLAPNAPEAATARWSGLPARAACLDVGLARLPRAAHTVAFGIDQPLYYSVHSATAALAPPNGAMIHVAKYLDATGRSDAAADQKELEHVLDVLQPGWRQQVVVHRFLPSMTVTNAVPLAISGGVKGRAPVEVREVPGLFLAGDWVGAHGVLANAAVASAAHAARLVAERGRRRLVSRGAGAVA